MDLNAMMITSSFFNNKFPYLDHQYHELAAFLLESTLRSIMKLESNDYRMIEFGLNGLSKVFIEEYSLYDTLMTRFENNVDKFTHY